VKIKPKKSLGQNFLIDKNILKKISNIANITNQNTIVEIGPGKGNLTEFLLMRNPSKLFVIEKDEKLSILLQNKFKKRIIILNRDILEFEDSDIFTCKTVVFGNLPYNISSQILLKFIINQNNFKYEKLIFMFQKELAERIIAKVNSKHYGRLSIISGWKFDIKKIIDIKPNCFQPKPKVESSLLIFENKKNYDKSFNPANLEKITRIFFNQKRKKIKKPLNLIFKNNLDVLKKLNLNQDLRPQNLKPETFFKITKEFENLI